MERRKDPFGRVLKTGEVYKPAKKIYEYRYIDTDGIRKSKYAKTLNELRFIEKEIALNIANGVKNDTKIRTVNDLYNHWLEVKRGLKHNTLQNYKYMYNRFVADSFGKMRLDKIKRTDVRLFYAKLVEDNKMGVATIDTIHNILHQVFEIGVVDEYMRYNPADNAFKELKKTIANDDNRRKSLTRAEAELFLWYIKNSKYEHWYSVFCLMLWTGMRAGEVTGLRWCDIDFRNRVISVNHTLVYTRITDDTFGLMINTPKTSASVRAVPMLSIVYDALVTERGYQIDNNIKCISNVDGYSDFIFINRNGEVQKKDILNKAIKRIVKDCNTDLTSTGNTDKLLPDFSCHTLRHTFASLLNESGVNVKVIQSILGHTDAALTLNIYTDVTAQYQAEELSKLNK